MTASLLILSWKRPENLTRIVSLQQTYNRLGEILIFNNNNSGSLGFSDPKVKVLNASCDFGLRTRWILAALATNDCLIFQDDDILLSEEAVEAFVGAISLDSTRIYSLHGRNPSPDGKYNTEEAEGEVEIVLTRAAAIHKRVVPLIFQSEQEFREAGLVIPANNGEDIFLSYCISSHFGKKHLTLKLPFTDLPSPYALSSRPGHFVERTKVVRQCKKFFLSRTENAQRVMT